MARKPLSEKSVAENVLKWGTGGINVDGSRIGTEKISAHHAGSSASETYSWNKGDKKDSSKEYYDNEGRFPANIIFDEEAGQELDKQSGFSKSKSFVSNMRDIRGNGDDYFTSTSGNKRKVRDIITENGHNDEGGASRYFLKIDKNE